MGLADSRRTTFLEVLAASGNVSAACRSVGIARTTSYHYKEADSAFSEAWENAVEQHTDKLENRLTDRAVDGVLQPVFHKGRVTGHVRKYSDTVGMFLLKGKRKQYRDRVEHGVTGNIVIDVVNYSGLPAPEHAKLEDPDPDKYNIIDVETFEEIEEVMRDPFEV